MYFRLKVDNCIGVKTEFACKYSDLATYGALAQGGTFVAEGKLLLEFKINIGFSLEGNTKPIILGTTENGIPTNGPILWEGDYLSAPFSGDIIFTPNLPLVVGERYFIGLDYGYLTSAEGYMAIGGNTNNPIPNGQAWRALDSGWDQFNTDVDIAIRIVMLE